MHMGEFLKNKKYKKYKNGHYQKIVKNPNVVCDLNDRLAINLTKFNRRNTFEMQIILEREEKWYDFKIYGLSEQDIFNDLEKMENKLITIAETL